MDVCVCMCTNVCVSASVKRHHVSEDERMGREAGLRAHVRLGCVRAHVERGERTVDGEGGKDGNGSARLL